MTDRSRASDATAQAIKVREADSPIAGGGDAFGGDVSRVYTKLWMQGSESFELGGMTETTVVHRRRRWRGWRPRERRCGRRSAATLPGLGSATTRR
jgi:hypothetical protein